MRETRVGFQSSLGGALEEAETDGSLAMPGSDERGSRARREMGAAAEADVLGALLDVSACLSGSGVFLDRLPALEVSSGRPGRWQLITRTERALARIARNGVLQLLTLQWVAYANVMPQSQTESLKRRWAAENDGHFRAWLFCGTTSVAAELNRRQIRRVAPPVRRIAGSGRYHHAADTVDRHVYFLQVDGSTTRR